MKVRRLSRYKDIARLPALALVGIGISFIAW